MNSPIRIRDTVALLFVIALAAIALVQAFSIDLHVPAARMLVAECQGFEALASAGETRMTCDAATSTSGFVAPVVEGSAGPYRMVASSSHPGLT